LQKNKIGNDENVLKVPIHAKTLRWLLSIAEVKRRERKVFDIDYQYFAFSAYNTLRPLRELKALLRHSHISLFY